MGWGNQEMRTVLTCVGLLLSVVAAQADKVVASGRPLMLYEAYSTNPDCSSAGNVVLRVAQSPEHGRVSMGPEADINRNCRITADWPPGIGPHRDQPPFIMS
jgi:hypothetical protein